MYEYDPFDQKLVEERSRQFRDQVVRRMDGRITEDEFKPLRLQNGLYMQLHAYMMRIAIPYGLLASRQVRALARITRLYDRGYGHDHNVVAHSMPGHCIVNLSCKSHDLPPGDVTAEQLDALADLADDCSFGQPVVTHRQNLVFTDVRRSDLPGSSRGQGPRGCSQRVLGAQRDLPTRRRSPATDLAQAEVSHAAVRLC